jgi:cyclophilin family peptidyl-prolyl cis-trans isomerase
MNFLKASLALGACWLGLMSAVIADEAKPGQQVEIRTSLGSIVVELDPASSPRSCEAFLSYIHQLVYQQSDFRENQDGCIEGGRPGPASTGFSKSGNFFQNMPPGEFKLKHVRGAIGMSRTVGYCNPTKASDSTQFYIMRQDVPKSDGEYSVFGHVVRGMDVVDEISAALEKDKTTPIKFDVVAL